MRRESLDSPLFLIGLTNFGKSLVLIIYGPGILSFFPRISLWIDKVFPTYDTPNPICEVSQNKVGITDIAMDLGILASAIIVLITVVFLVRKQMRLQIAKSLASFEIIPPEVYISCVTHITQGDNSCGV